MLWPFGEDARFRRSIRRYPHAAHYFMAAEPSSWWIVDAAKPDERPPRPCVGPYRFRLYHTGRWASFYAFPEKLEASRRRFARLDRLAQTCGLPGAALQETVVLQLLDDMMRIREVLNLPEDAAGNGDFGPLLDGVREVERMLELRKSLSRRPAVQPPDARPPAPAAPSTSAGGAG